jgi:Asp-tRNA(Asn)/Glu-tRNA(Gln) amidotransferase A subunit family amidase
LKFANIATLIGMMSRDQAAELALVALDPEPHLVGVGARLLGDAYRVRRHSGHLGCHREDVRIRGAALGPLHGIPTSIKDHSA